MLARSSTIPCGAALLVGIAACGAQPARVDAAPIGESRAPSGPAIDAACRALCALRPDYAGSSKPAPLFELATLDGRTVKMEELRGKVVLLNVWSSIAAGAVTAEMPELAKLAAALRSRKDVVLVSIAAEDYPEHAADLLKATLGDATKYTVLVDRGAKVAEEIGTRKYPETWLVDRNGIMRARFDGKRTWSEPKVMAMLDATRDGAFCPVEIDEGYISGAGDNACEAAAK